MASYVRRAYTLTELLVVMIIIGILITATLPIARRVMEDSRTREASRQLHALFTMARTRAAQTGRPFGVWLELNAPLGTSAAAVGGPPNRYVRQATRFYLAEVPQAYAGSTLWARARIADSSGSGTGPYYLQLTTAPGGTFPDNTEMGMLRALINDGESFIARFDYKGEWFRFTRSGTNFVYQGTVNNVNVSAPTNPAGYPFQILRMPRRVGSPTQLTGGTAVDMSYSGFGRGGNQACLVSNYIAVMFMPSGAIDGVVADGVITTPPGTLHFLVGKVDKVGDPLATNANHASGVNFFDLATSNLADPNSLWVSIGRNGSVTTAPNLPDVEHASHSSGWTPAGMIEFLEECRQDATTREQMGGK
jgi:prepilin-type N-terminal cleavage/methylation domain-containing protein